MKKQEIEEIIKKLNEKMLNSSQRYPCLAIDNNNKAVYISKHTVDETRGESYDIDMVEFPRSELEKLIECALSAEHAIVSVFTKGKRYAAHSYSKKPAKTFDVDIELSLRIRDGNPSLTIKYDNKKHKN